GTGFDIDIKQALAVNQCNTQLFGLGCVSHHSFHGVPVHSVSRKIIGTRFHPDCVGFAQLGIPNRVQLRNLFVPCDSVSGCFGFWPAALLHVIANRCGQACFRFAAPAAITMRESHSELFIKEEESVTGLAARNCLLGHASPLQYISTLHMFETVPAACRTTIGSLAAAHQSCWPIEA